MMRKTLTHSILIVAAGAALCAPGAYAGSNAGDFWSQLNSSDGGGNVFAHVPERAKVSATPEQAANLRYLETQRQISDGSDNHFAGIPERAKVPATPEQAANLRYLEGQRQISDGSGPSVPGSEASIPSQASAPETASRHAEARGSSMDRVQ